MIAQTGDDASAAVLLERRPDAGVWGGLWSPPQFASQEEALRWCVRELGAPVSQPEALEPIDHAFTHFDLRLNPIRIKCDAVEPIQDSSRQWYQLSNPSRVGLPQPIRQLFARLRD